MSENETHNSGKIAIIGLSGRFPGASDPAEYWQKLIDGESSIRVYEPDELKAVGIDAAVLDAPNYIRSHGEMEEAKTFDADFFGIEEQEASITDPQHRHFLEHAWLALEDAGYDPARFEGAIGVYGGMHLSSYLLRNLLPNGDLVRQLGELELRLRNDKDFLTTLVAYKLGATGPTLNVQTACASSLVAVSLACQALLTYQCDLALAGGVSIQSPTRTGYLSQPGLFSMDGQCRPFDAAASGTISGNGVGLVALRRLEDALADGDAVRAVILGSAITNDGGDKVGYSAPGIEGQRSAIQLAQILADVEPASIGLIEAHGTGTPLGDAVEVEALAQSFAEQEGADCFLGSVKANIGHLDAAAGIAGLIKAVLALEQGEIPPQPHAFTPNPEIDWQKIPFRVPEVTEPWPEREEPRRAGVSSFALGGVNAHVILEEAPFEEAQDEPESLLGGPQLLVLSARTPEALEAMSDRLVAHLDEFPDEDLSDLAFTLWQGRRSFAHRRFWLARDPGEARGLLSCREPERVWTTRAGEDLPVAFLFPGLGEQYPNMARELYQSEDVFRDTLDACLDQFREHLDQDLFAQLYPQGVEGSATAEGGVDFRALVRGTNGSEPLAQTDVAQPLVFAVSYALARWWIHHGVEPQALLGHSLGEVVAACVAGVFTLEDAARLVATRARLVAELPAGAMLAVPMAAAELRPVLDTDLAVSVLATPELTVVGGEPARIDALALDLAERGVLCQRLATTHAFHSHLLDPILDRFHEAVAECTLMPPEIPLVSNVTGTWLSDDEATDPGYWVSQLRSTVRFGEGLEVLWQEPCVLLEVGPGASLGAWARQHSSCPSAGRIFASVRHSLDHRSDRAVLLEALGKLWSIGAELDMDALFYDRSARRLHLPTYPFERRRLWIDPPKGSPRGFAVRSIDAMQWLDEHRGPWLIFADDGPWIPAIELLEARGEAVWKVTSGEAFERFGPTTFQLSPQSLDDHRRLVAALAEEGWPGTILHGWSLAQDPDQSETSRLHLAQAFGGEGAPPLAEILVSTDELAGLMAGIESLHQPQAVSGAELGGEVGTIERAPYEAPRNDVERRLCDLFAGLVGQKQVGIRDHFFDLGGDSLRAARCLALIEEEFGVALRLKTLFEAPRVAALAPLVVAERAEQFDEEALLAALAASKGLSKEALVAELEAAEED